MLRVTLTKPTKRGQNSTGITMQARPSAWKGSIQVSDGKYGIWKWLGCRAYKQKVKSKSRKDRRWYTQPILQAWFNPTQTTELKTVFFCFTSTSQISLSFRWAVETEKCPTDEHVLLLYAFVVWGERGGMESY